MRYQKLIRCVTAFIAALLMMLSTVLPSLAVAEPETVITVGYAGLQGFLYKDDNGNYHGIAYDLLQEMAVYNNWKYELVETSYSECAKLLESGRIDIFIPFQKDEEREQLYEFSNQVFCTNSASLLTLPNSEIYYDDFENMDGITIGAPMGTKNDRRFAEFFEEIGCSVEIKKDYSNQPEMLEALKNGEIDAFISASNRGIVDCKIITVLSETNSYAVAKKGNREVLDKFDYALECLYKDDPNLWNTLNVKYSKSTEGSYPSLTRAEAEYILEKRQVTVLVSENECDSNGDFTGASKIVFDCLNKTTGIEFVPYISDGSMLLEDFSMGKADMIFSFNHDYEWASLHNGWLTHSYAEFYNKIVTNPSVNEIKTVAVVPNTYIEYYVKNEFDYETVEYDSYMACLDGVLNGEVDAMYCTSPIGNYYSTFSKYRTLSFLSAYDFYGSYCMSVSKSSNPMLVDILNKAINCLPNEVLSQIFDVQDRVREYTLEDTFYAHPTQWIIILIIVVAILCGLLFLAMYTAAIKRKNRELAVANSAKTDFLASMSHDMRTPMNGILGLTRITKEEKDIAVIKENLNQIETSGRYLLRLINDTLDMNKVEAGNFELHPQPLIRDKVLKNVISNASITAKEKGIVFMEDFPENRFGGSIAVLTDGYRLEQILTNVISNAVNFTHKGGMVTFKVETVSVDEDFIVDRYIISDNGIGMSEEFLSHVYEPFSQERRVAVDGNDEGVGLGLSIVKQLCNLMGGEINIASHIDEGTEVTLTMKYPRCNDYMNITQKEQPKSTITADLTVLNGRRVLICEDQPLNARIVEKMLEKESMFAETAENGKIGLEMFLSSPIGYYDLILMDIRMPEMNGLEATKAIRASDRSDGKEIPIIAMTANAFESDVKNCLAVGMNVHLPKPVDPETLYKTMAEQFPTDFEI